MSVIWRGEKNQTSTGTLTFKKHIQFTILRVSEFLSKCLRVNVVYFLLKPNDVNKILNLIKYGSAYFETVNLFQSYW